MKFRDCTSVRPIAAERVMGARGHSPSIISSNIQKYMSSNLETLRKRLSCTQRRVTIIRTTAMAILELVGRSHIILDLCEFDWHLRGALGLGGEWGGSG